MSDFIFRGKLQDIDTDVSRLIDLEQERQVNKLILIPSESLSPVAVREALGSVFQNIYAEGYPDDETRQLSQAQLMNVDERIGYYRRYSDPRYYKGVEIVDIVEALARRRVAEVFETQAVSADQLFVNVQSLSGAPANNAVFSALINPGDTIMGLALTDGGHLSHGSSVNRSGKIYQSVPYQVDPVSEQLNYDSIEKLAKEKHPKIIIAGYSSYPWAVDWIRLQTIAKSVGAYLVADISHVAGLVAGGVYPSPVGIADVITFTTHKTLCGPRGACIITSSQLLSKKIDRAVFPGEQGGPHIHAIAAIAVAMKLAKTEQFKLLQKQIVLNCGALSSRLAFRGFRIPFGGTNTHLTNMDCSSVKGKDGTTLSGDQAARILDLAGIVVNRNTIPGDVSAVDPSGIRLGTPWVTQRGLREKDMVVLADTIADLFSSIEPYSYEGRKNDVKRAKVDFDVLEKSKGLVRSMVEQMGADMNEKLDTSSPHYFVVDEPSLKETTTIEIAGEKASQFLNYCLVADIDECMNETPQANVIFVQGNPIRCTLYKHSKLDYELVVESKQAKLVITWLKGLSDGFIKFDNDVIRKLPGPVVIRKVVSSELELTDHPITVSDKPFYIGMEINTDNPLPEFVVPAEGNELKRTPIYATHKRLGAKIIPFAGWEMPVWYTSVVEEHQAVRSAAGVFDVSHMGVYQVEGANAEVFLDCVVGNDISALKIGESCYTHLLTPNAEVIDDLIIYRRDYEKFLMVVNASNDEKDWKWLNEIKLGIVQINREYPASKAFGRDIRLRNLRQSIEGADMRVDIALQGPKSRDILIALGVSEEHKREIMRLKRTELCEARVGEFDLIISRTGYTGEKMAFELFVHPLQAEQLFNQILDIGKVFGVKPIGLGARDSLRTEAGLPLYGHEMGFGTGRRGVKDLGVAEAGFRHYVKVYKPWFIGREAFIERLKLQQSEVVRFRFTEKGVRMAHNGDPVIDKKGKVVGFVTSCAIDQQGFLTGQAYIDIKLSEEGTCLFIYQGSPEKIGKAPSELAVNEKITLPAQMLVASRFL